MAEYLIRSETLDGIADAINAKTGGSAAMTPAEMVTAIAAIPSGGGGSQITKDEWTLASDWNKTTQDFFYSSYVDRNFDGVQLFGILNNSASSSVAHGAYTRKGVSNLPGVNAYFRDSSLTIASAGQVFNISAGAVIVRYKIPSDAFPA